MKKILTLLAVLLLLAGCASAAPKSAAAAAPELLLAEKGKSSMVIVLPDPMENKNLDNFLMQYTKEFAAILAESTGVKYAIIRESKLPAGAPAIMVGKTRFAVESGVDFAKLRPWDAVIKVRGNRLILAGIDRPGTKFSGKNSRTYFLSSVRAMTEFLQKFAQVRFLIPGWNGIHAPRLARLAVPGGTDMIARPCYRYGRRRPVNQLFEIANGFFNAIDTKLYGGHSYYTAVPAWKYAKTHPEYFHMSGDSHSAHGGHLCISNPAVQDLMLKEMVKQADAGYDMVELSQTDAYVPCVCTNCKKLYNTDSDSEKLWLLHRDLAERFAKVRPGKKVMIIAYYPTAAPPVSFKKFPENVCIELCAYSKENLDRWAQYEVPQGFTVYLYNWGAYNTMGLGPKRTVAFLENQLQLFRNYNIHSLYFCGSSELYGLEGPAYYAYFRMMNDPAVKGADAFREYIRCAFGEASLPMEKFYNAIDSALNSYQGNMRGIGRTILAPRGVIPGVFTPDVMGLLSTQLKAAESLARTPKVKARLRLVRREFDFFNSTVRGIVFYNAYRLAPNWATFSQLEKEIAHRNKLLDLSFHKGEKGKAKTLKDWPDVRLFGHANTRKGARAYGSSSAAMGAPFDWDFKLLRRHKVLPFATMPRVVVKRAAKDAFNFNFDSGDWAKAKWTGMTGIQLGTPSVTTRFKVLYDSKYLYVAFDGEMKNARTYRPMKKDGKCWGQDGFEIMLDPFGDRARHFHLLFNFLPDSFYDARRGFVNDMLDPNFHSSDPAWDGKWEYKTRIRNKRVQAVVRLAHSSMNVPAPRKGTLWTGNFGREEFHDGVKNPELMLWAPNPEAKNFHDRDKFGELVFE